MLAMGCAIPSRSESARSGRKWGFRWKMITPALEVARNAGVERPQKAAVRLPIRFPWDEAPRYLIRDRDTSYGAAVPRRLRAMGIRRPADHATLTVAERACRTADWLDPT